MDAEYAGMTPGELRMNHSYPGLAGTDDILSVFTDRKPCAGKGLNPS